MNGDEIITDSDINESMRREELFKQYLMSEEVSQRRLNRVMVNDACSRDAEARAMTWSLCFREDNPAEGCIFFIENFGWTVDPRQKGTTTNIPFILFEYQKEAIRFIVDHIDRGEDFLIEKSRDMGVTWLLVWVFLWYWLFRDGSNLLMGSYKERLVDDRTPDSVFGKLDYAVRSLPKWILPKGFSMAKHRTKLRLINPVNSNLISGESMNADFGRGSRKTASFYDELGFWDYARESWESGGDTTPCRIANSTPHGRNFYAKLRYDGIDVLTLHWSLHPLKDETWYEYEKSRRSPEELAQEIDISYDKSQEGRVYPEWNEHNVEFSKYDYDENLPLYVSWDFGKEDPTAIIWAQVKDGKLVIIDSLLRSGKNIDFFVPFITGVIPSDSYRYSKADIEQIESHKNWKTGTHFGDPAGNQKNCVNDHTVLSVLSSYGIHVNFNYQWNPFQTRRRSLRSLLMRGVNVNKTDRTDELSNCIEQATYIVTTINGEKQYHTDKPRHDWTSHYRSSFEYLALGIESMLHSQVKVRDSVKKRQQVTRRRLTGY